MMLRSGHQLNMLGILLSVLLPTCQHSIDLKSGEVDVSAPLKRYTLMSADTVSMLREKASHKATANTNGERQGSKLASTSGML